MATATKERPILFSGPMIKAILPGDKTQTRRVVMSQPPADHPYPQECHEGRPGEFWWWNDSESDNDDISFWPSYQDAVRCPFGGVGDILWVRETFSLHKSDGIVRVLFRSDESCWHDPRPFAEHYTHRRPVYVMRSDWSPIEDGESITWKPSIFMPRWASRIRLEITRVRVQRLQEISEEDAVAEGIHSMNFTGWGDDPGIPSMPESDVYQNYLDQSRHGCGWLESPVESYRTLWDSINGKRPGCAWADNPWIWALTFRRLEN